MNNHHKATRAGTLQASQMPARKNCASPCASGHEALQHDHFTSHRAYDSHKSKDRTGAREPWNGPKPMPPRNLQDWIQLVLNPPTRLGSAKTNLSMRWGMSLWPSPWCRYATTPSASLNFLSTSLLRFSLPSPLPVSNHAPEGKRSLVQPRHSLYSDLADQGQGSYETGRGSRGNQTAWFQIL